MSIWCGQCAGPMAPDEIRWKLHGVDICEGCARELVEEAAITAKAKAEGDKLMQKAWEATGRKHFNDDDLSCLDNRPGSEDEDQ